jgi:hypothetical protein
MRYRQQIWAGYTEMLQGNPLIQSPVLFHRWLAGCYTDAQQVAIRQQSEGGDPRVISLGKLLKDIEANPSAPTRRGYLLGFPAEDRTEASGWFDSFAGSSGAHLDPRVPARDFKELRNRPSE